MAFGGIGVKRPQVSLQMVSTGDAETLLREDVASDETVRSLTFQSNGRMLAVGELAKRGKGARVLLWDVEKPGRASLAKELATDLADAHFTAFNETVEAANSLLAVAGPRLSGGVSVVQIWNPATGRRASEDVAVADKTQAITGLAWLNAPIGLPPFIRIASTTEKTRAESAATIRIAGKTLLTLPGKSIVSMAGTGVFALAINDKTKANSELSTQVALWSPGGREPTPLEDGLFLGEEVAVAMSADGKYSPPGDRVTSTISQARWRIRYAFGTEEAVNSWRKRRKALKTPWRRLGLFNSSPAAFTPRRRNRCPIQSRSLGDRLIVI